jgi:hypothetical protein
MTQDVEPIFDECEQYDHVVGGLAEGEASQSAGTT